MKSAAVTNPANYFFLLGNSDVKNYNSLFRASEDSFLVNLFSEK
jgi:hypothetical protein